MRQVLLKKIFKQLLVNSYGQASLKINLFAIERLCEYILADWKLFFPFLQNILFHFAAA